MAKRTRTKEQRARYLVKKFSKDGQPIKLGGLVGFAPPEPRKEVEIEFRGEIYKVFVAPGQIINPKKEKKRLMKLRGDRW